MPSAHRYRVTVVSGTPAQAEASARGVWAQSGAMAARVYATDRLTPGGPPSHLGHLGALPQFTTLMVEDATPGARRPTRTTYYLWLNGTVSRTHATRPTDAPARARA